MLTIRALCCIIYYSVLCTGKRFAVTVHENKMLHAMKNGDAFAISETDGYLSGLKFSAFVR